MLPFEMGKFFKHIFLLLYLLMCLQHIIMYSEFVTLAETGTFFIISIIYERNKIQNIEP